MLTNYHTIEYVTGTFQRNLVHRTITAAFTQERDQLILQFAGGETSLVISCDRIFNTMYLRESFARARVNSVNVLSGCLDRTIVEIRMHPLDRVVMFSLDSGCRIDLLFFGAKSNVVLIDQTGNIVDAFKDARNLIGCKAEYRSGVIVYDMATLSENLDAAKSPTAFSALKNSFPTLGSTLVREVLYRAETQTAETKAIGKQELLNIQSALGSVLSEMGTPEPRVYLDESGTPAHFSLITLKHLKSLPVQQFTSVHEAIRFFVSRTRSREATDDAKRSVVGKLQQKLSKARRTIAAVESDVNANRRAEEYQRFGDLLMMNQDSVDGKAKNVQIDGVPIPLQEHLSAVQNAQRYFDKAKRSRTAHGQATERLKELCTSIAPVERLLLLLNDVNSKEELKQFMTEYKSELEELGIAEKGEQRELLPFRVFTVDGGFQVWAGKSSKNNDALTVKYSKPNDLWFHARGSSGSHVVLKVNSGKGEPSKKAREQAASIAAYYSKMKNAKMVPVAMTEKKYVRKQKGAAPGSVVVEREKVIFAEPGLPGVKANH